jgi:hypothetical protein
LSIHRTERAPPFLGRAFPSRLEERLLNSTLPRDPRPFPLRLFFLFIHVFRFSPVFPRPFPVRLGFFRSRAFSPFSLHPFPRRKPSGEIFPGFLPFSALSPFHRAALKSLGRVPYGGAGGVAARRRTAPASPFRKELSSIKGRQLRREFPGRKSAAPTSASGKAGRPLGEGVPTKGAGGGGGSRKRRGEREAFAGEKGGIGSGAETGPSGKKTPYGGGSGRKGRLSVALRTFEGP